MLGKFRSSKYFLKVLLAIVRAQDKASRIVTLLPDKNFCKLLEKLIAGRRVDAWARWHVRAPGTPMN